MMKRESRYGRGVLETKVVSQLKSLGVRTGYLRRSVSSHAGLTWYTSQREREREGGGVLVGSTWGCPFLGNVLTVFVALKKMSFSHTKCNCSSH